MDYWSQRLRFAYVIDTLDIHTIFLACVLNSFVAFAVIALRMLCGSVRYFSFDFYGWGVWFNM